MAANKHYILDGKIPKPVDDFMKWARWFEKANRVVKKTEVLGCEISTVFLGIDHAFFWWAAFTI